MLPYGLRASGILMCPMPMSFYAFLSPAPMARLSEKLKAEMKPGSCFISNSFAVPGGEPDEIVIVDDSRQTQLLIWRM